MGDGYTKHLLINGVPFSFAGRVIVLSNGVFLVLFSSSANAATSPLR